MHRQTGETYTYVREASDIGFMRQRVMQQPRYYETKACTVAKPKPMFSHSNCEEAIQLWRTTVVSMSQSPTETQHQNKVEEAKVETDCNM